MLAAGLAVLAAAIAASCLAQAVLLRNRALGLAETSALAAARAQALADPAGTDQAGGADRVDPVDRVDRVDRSAGSVLEIGCRQARVVAVRNGAVMLRCQRFRCVRLPGGDTLQVAVGLHAVTLGLPMNTEALARAGPKGC